MVARSTATEIAAEPEGEGESQDSEDGDDDCSHDEARSCCSRLMTMDVCFD